MEGLTKLITSLSPFAWPIIVIVLVFKFANPIGGFVKDFSNKKLKIKFGEYELSIEEVSDQQRTIVGDIQLKVAELEKKLSGFTATLPQNKAPSVREDSLNPINRRILWVDDLPRNNAYLVSLLKERNDTVDIARNTEEGMRKLQEINYDIIISDMKRPESDKAGIELAERIRIINKKVPVFIFCGGWAAQNMKEEALRSGVNGITSSSTTLLSMLGKN
ncbi:MAG: response regulator [Magnetococcus sp. DMHC-1]|nr:response regulator [Magnetococcales bacterium]MBF0155133.1 response regulator [Magnetococcales bacterium]